MSGTHLPRSVGSGVDRRSRGDASFRVFFKSSVKGGSTQPPHGSAPYVLSEFYLKKNFLEFPPPSWPSSCLAGPRRKSFPHPCNSYKVGWFVPVYFEQVADGTPNALRYADEVARNGALQRITSARGFLGRPLLFLLGLPSPPQPGFANSARLPPTPYS
jgi:hypothetical protein